jgi:hypothetical protein
MPMCEAGRVWDEATYHRDGEDREYAGTTDQPVGRRRKRRTNLMGMPAMLGSDTSALGSWRTTHPSLPRR